jgi:hypothetical protein
MNDVSHLNRLTTVDVERGPSIFCQIIVGLVIVAAVLAAGTAMPNWATEQPIQESGAFCDAFSLFW